MVSLVPRRREFSVAHFYFRLRAQQTLLLQVICARYLIYFVVVFLNIFVKYDMQVRVPVLRSLSWF